jgi:pyruvate,water dikinase
VRSGSIDLEEYEARERSIREAAEKKVRSHLSGWKLWVYEWSMRHARLAVKNRENLRFCRTRIYGVVRQMFYGIGNEYTLRGIIDAPEDIFYITLDELTGTLDGVLPCQNVKGLIDVRKAEYIRYADIEPDSRFVTRGACYWGNNHLPKEVEVDDSDLPENCIKGLGCCPGIVEGIVKVVLSPDDDMELDGEILVTSRTDPGWIPLYPSISGLLVERGGLLSHSAIVAREMGLPTVVSIRGLTKRLETGMKIKFDGQTGIIEILE